jgi:hypothetical protein
MHKTSRALVLFQASWERSTRHRRARWAYGDLGQDGALAILGDEIARAVLPTGLIAQRLRARHQRPSAVFT